MLRKFGGDIGFARTGLLLLGTLLTLAQAAQAEDWTKITIATTRNFMPYNGTGADGKPIGFEIDLANDLCVRMKADCRIVATPNWAGLIDGLVAGRYDAIMAAMNITPKRLEVIDFSHPYAQSPSTFAVRAASPLAAMPVRRVRLDDSAATAAMVKELIPFLTGKRIGVQASTNHVDLLNAHFNDFVGALRIYGSSPAAIHDLQAGRLDAVVQLTTYFATVLPRLGGDRLVLSGPIMTGGVLGPGAGVGLRKQDDHLKALFDKAIDDARSDGTLRHLTTKWFKADIRPPD